MIEVSLFSWLDILIVLKAFFGRGSVFVPRGD